MLPKATGREAMLEKKAIRREQVSLWDSLRLFLCAPRRLLSAPPQSSSKPSFDGILFRWHSSAPAYDSTRGRKFLEDPPSIRIIRVTLELASMTPCASLLGPSLISLLGRPFQALKVSSSPS